MVTKAGLNAQASNNRQMFNYQLFAAILKGEVKEVAQPEQKPEPGIAPRSHPTRATFGKYSASID